MIGYFITNIGLRRCKIFMFKSKKGLIKNSYRLSVHPGVDLPPPDSGLWKVFVLALYLNYQYHYQQFSQY